LEADDVQSMLFPPPAVQKVQFDPRKVRGGVSSVRILIVEDFPRFRQFICSMLGERNDLQIIGEAADGLEAVQKAVELKPDLILMDIGLPSLNGIEAARQIRKLVPESKIIFLSQESSSEVMQEALSLGARGYVVKIKATSELMTVIDAAI
jgi:DNA-binding NarL/FixJ family response regulator